MRVTQKEIATKMGVSISLVSRVLSGTAEEIGVPAETIREVQKTAKKMGYVPNKAAQALKGKATKTIGVVVYDFKDPFFSDFVAHLQEKFHSKGYSTVLVGFSDRQINERDLTPLREHLLDAVIVLGSDFSGSIHQDIHDGPIFRIGHGAEGEPTITYSPDETGVALDLAEYLSELKCESIQILHADVWNHEKRAQGMIEIFEQKGFRVTVDATENGNSLYDAGFNFGFEKFDLSKLPDVIVCCVDQLALGVMKGLMSRGVQIPKEVKVVGFDNIRFAAQFHPSLTTFSQPMGDTIDKIIDRLEKQNFSVGIELFKCPLVKRESC